MLFLTDSENYFSKCSARAYLSDVSVHRRECVNSSSSGFYQNVSVFLLAASKLSHSHLSFILHIIHFTTVFSFSRIHPLIILEDVNKIFLLEWLICLTCVFNYLIICCRYNVPYNYVVPSEIAENTILNLIRKQNMLNFKYVNECTTYPYWPYSGYFAI